MSEKKEKEVGKEVEEKKEEKKEPSPPRPLTPVEVLYKNLKRLEKSVSTHDRTQLMRALRYTTPVRRHVDIDVIVAVVERFVSDDEIRGVILELLTAARAAAPAAAASGDGDIDLDGDAAAAPTELDPPEAGPPSLGAACGQEVAAYLHLLAVSLLVQYKQWGKVLPAAGALCAALQVANKRSLDPFSAKAWGFYSLAVEKSTGDLASIRGELLTAYRTACLRHDEIGQATLLNLVLRNYLHYNLFDQAQKLVAKSSFPEGISNNQLVRFLYYQGRINAVQLDYTDAYTFLIQAERKAPTNTAFGFRIAAKKMAVVVQLLMGEIPERSMFKDDTSQAALAPYFALTQAVRVGDLAAFNATVAMHEATLRRDLTYKLVTRLRQNVIKTGLRKISTSYSRIHFSDIAAKLCLDSAEDAEFLCAKAIRDGVIDASLNHAEGTLLSKETLDVYSTLEPQQSFHKRITFCLDVHNEAVMGMRYPPDAHKKDLESAQSERLEREKDEQELADELADDMEDEDEEM